MEEGFVTLLLKVGGILFIILGLLFGFIFIIKRFRPGLITSLRGEHGMRLVGSLRLGTRHSIAILEVQDKWLIIGIAPESMSLIHTMDKPDADSSLPEKESQFKEILDSKSPK